MNLSELKRKLTVGTKLIKVNRFGQELNVEMIITKVQTNGIYLAKPENKEAIEKGKGSWLEFYPASLTEIDDKGFSVYGVGERQLTEEEAKVVEGYEAIRDRKQEEYDALTDGTSTFWQEQRYYKNNNMEYLFGGYTSHGNRFVKRANRNKNPMTVYDPTIRGTLELSYLFV